MRPSARQTGAFERRARGSRWLGFLVVATSLALFSLVSGPTATALAASHRASRSCGGGQAPGPAPAQTGSARLALNIAGGVVGTRLVAHGSGWPAGTRVLVGIEQNGQPISAVQSVLRPVAADGTFEAPAIAAPPPGCTFQPEPGTVVQVVARSLDNHTVASATFTYVAEPPVLAPPWTGSTITSTTASVSVTGLGWGAGTAVALWAPIGPAGMNSQNPWSPPAGVPVAQVRADGSGAFAAHVPLAPSGGALRPGTFVSLAASATDPLYGNVAVIMSNQFMVGMSVMPVVALDHAQGLAGAALTVTGDHWWPGDTVQVAYCRGVTNRCNPYLMQQLGTAVVDASGHFAAHVALPNNARVGPISVEAYVGNAAASLYLFTQAFEVVTAPLPWNKVHPRLALYLPILGVTLLLLAVAAAILWRPAMRRWRAAVSSGG